MAHGNDGREVSLEGLIRGAFNHMLSDVRVAMPGKIEDYDPSTGLASVKPMLQRRYSGDPEPTSLPILQRVPLVFPRCGKAILSFPVASGDPVLLVFADRAIDNWLGGDGSEPADPQDIRQHDLTDAFAILGGWPELRSGDHPAPSGEAAELLVAPNTKIAFGNGTDELLQIAHDAFSSLKDLADELKNTLAEAQAIQTIVASGSSAGTYPISPANVANFATIETAVDGVITDIDAEISSLGNLKV